MQHSNQEPYKTGEFDLVKLIYILANRKLFIFGFTALVTLLAIIYVLNLTPTYKATSSFTSPNDNSIVYLNKLPLTAETNNSVFSKFLILLSSRQFQIKVFLDGDYLTSLNPENKPIVDVDQFILEHINTVTISRPEITVTELKLGFLDELPYSISMKGANAEFISRYLNELVDVANTQTVNELISLIKHKIDVRLNQLQTERELLLAKAKQDRLNEIVILNSSATIAGSLGIVENNFNQISDDRFDTTLFVAIGENQMLPDWYLYGEKALLEKINILKNRTLDEPFIPEITELDFEAQALESIIIDTREINSMELNQTAFTTMIFPNKRQIVLIAFIGGLLMSILLVLTIEALQPYKENSA